LSFEPNAKPCSGSDESSTGGGEDTMCATVQALYCGLRVEDDCGRLSAQQHVLETKLFVHKALGRCVTSSVDIRQRWTAPANKQHASQLSRLHMPSKRSQLDTSDQSSPPHACPRRLLLDSPIAQFV
jgi:hypothetical protein